MRPENIIYYYNINIMDKFDDKLELAIKEKYQNNEKYFFVFNSYLKHKKNQNLQYIEKVVSRNGLELEFVTEQNENLCKRAIKQNIYSYVFIKDNDIRKKLQNFVLEQDNSLFDFIDEQSEELCVSLLKNNGLVLQYIKDKNQKYCYLAVQQNPLALQYVNKENQTPELYQIAVRKNGLSLQYVKEQNHDICILAIRQNPIALEYVETQTDKLIKNIMDNLKKWLLLSDSDILAIFSRIKNQTYQICKFFVELLPECLRCIKSQSDELSFDEIEKLSLIAMDKFYQNKDNLKKDLLLDDIDLPIGDNDVIYPKNKFEKGKNKISANLLDFENPFVNSLIEKYQRRNSDLELNFFLSNNNNDVILNYEKMIKERKNSVNEFSFNKKTNEKPAIISWIQLWTPKIYEKLLTYDYESIVFFEEPTEDMYIIVVRQDGMMLQFIKEENQTEKICKEAIHNNINAFEFVHNKTHDMCLSCISQNHYLIQYVDNPTDLMCKIVIDKCKSIKDFSAFKYIKNKNFKLERIVVQFDGLALEFIENQNDAICELAVKQNGLALKFVKKQTNNICELAVKQNGLALEFVENKTDKICELAVKQNSIALKFVDLLTEDLLSLHKNTNNNNYIDYDE
jgi:hypothetical protein